MQISADAKMQNVRMQNVLLHKVRGLASTGPGGALSSSWIIGTDEMGQQLCDVELHRPVFSIREGLVPDEVCTAVQVLAGLMRRGASTRDDRQTSKAL